MTQLKASRSKAKQQDKPKQGKKKSDKQPNLNRQLSSSKVDDDPENLTPQQDDDAIGQQDKSSLEQNQEIPIENPIKPDDDSGDDGDDDDLKELEQQIEDEDDSPFALIRTDTNWANEIIEDDTIDASTPEGIEQIQDAIEGLLLDLELNQALAPAMQQELEERGKLIKQLAPEEIEDIVSTFEKAEQFEEIISRPIVPEDEIDQQELQDISETQSLEQELQLELQAEDISKAEQLLNFLEQMSEDNIDRILQIEDDLVFLEEQNQIIYRQIRQLQEKLGIIREDETKSKISFKTKKRAKDIAKKGLLIAKYTAPVAEVPIRITQSTLAVISLAKTIKHILNMKGMLEQVENAEVKRILLYAISQKTQKAAKKGLTSVQLGLLPKSYTLGKAIYKKVTRTKGTVREENARSLHNLAIRGDREAAALIRELVGSGNIAAALNPEKGWDIVKSKLASK